MAALGLWPGHTVCYCRPVTAAPCHDSHTIQWITMLLLLLLINLLDGYL